MLKRFKTGNVFINATFIYILANGIGQGTTLLSNIFFTRYMTQRDYGLYSNYYSLVAILGPFIGLNLYCGLSNAYIDYKAEIKNVRSSALLLSLVGLIGTSIVFAVVKMIIGLSMPWIELIAIVLHAYGFFLINYYIASMNMENRYLRKGLFLCIPNVMQAVFAIIAVIICNTYISRAIGSMIAVFIMGLLTACIVIREAKPKIKFDYWKFMLRISLPAVIGSVAAMIMQQCDKVMITSLYNAEATAVYALVFNIGYILYAVQQATSGVWQVWVYNSLGEKKYDKIPEVQRWYMFAMLIIATVLFMISPELIKILSPKNYWQFSYIPPFIWGSFVMLMYSFHISVIEFNKRTEITSAIVAIATVMNIVLNYILIPRFGGVAAAFTSVFSYLCIFLISGLYVKSKFTYTYSKEVFLIMGIIMVGMGTLFYFLSNMILIRYLVYISILFYEFMIIWKNKNKLESLFKN